MANRHFGKLADAWKHLPLAEVLSIERPSHYWESHAGSALYPMVNDAERRFGAQRFLAISGNFPRLTDSRYRDLLVSMASGSDRLNAYPGSPLVAMTELGSACSYLLCDTDERSTADLEAAAERLELQSQVEIANTDGMSALHDELMTLSSDGKTVAHLDPFDPHAPGPAGLSVLDLAAELIASDVGLIYWYGYSDVSERGWALGDLASYDTGTPLWCGDIMVRSSTSEEVGGDLGDATTPGTGFGIVCANVSDHSISTCEQLGIELAQAYEGAPLPSGESGYLDFTVSRHP